MSRHVTKILTHTRWGSMYDANSRTWEIADIYLGVMLFSLMSSFIMWQNISGNSCSEQLVKMSQFGSDFRKGDSLQ